MTTNSPKHHLPLVSIVTIVFNGIDILEKTILSVINQTYPNIEYIVVDGGSTDGTVDIIKKYKGKISTWISENDRGIYDAMNKGTALATGEWLGFMNAGDSYFSESTLEKIFFQPVDADVIYGLTKRVFPDFEYIKQTKPIETLWRGMRFCHQSMFVKTSLQKENKFPLNSLNADYEFIYKMYLQNKIFLYLPIVIANFAEGGASTKSLLQSNYTNYKISNKLKKLSIRQKFFYLFAIISAVLMDFGRKLNSKSLEKYYKLKLKMKK